MTIFTGVRDRPQSFLEEFNSPFSDVIGATAEESLLFSPVSSIMRQRELQRARLGREPNWLDIRVFGDAAPSSASPMLDAEAARARIAESGLDLTVPDSGIRERALDILMERKREERRRQDVFNRAPSSGFTGWTARIGTMFGVSLLDPLNVASAFIPVVGEARYATMLGRAGGAFGRAGVRARVGALEGVVGAAAVEPVIGYAARQEQADYDLTDSLLNVAFGTVLGGGLHMGVGAAADAIRAGLDWRQARATEPLPQMLERAGAGTREQALRTAIAQAASGRAIDIEPLVMSAANANARLQEPMRAFAVGQEAGVVRVDLTGLPALERQRPQRRERGEFRPDLPPNPEDRMYGRPVIAMLKKAGGVHPDSALAGNLRALGLSSRNSPGLFNRRGRRSADNFVKSEHPIFLERAPDDTGTYIPEDTILDAVRDELFGAPWRTAEELAEIEQYRQALVALDVDREEVPGHARFIDQVPPPRSEEDYGTQEALAAREFADFEEGRLRQVAEASFAPEAYRLVDMDSVRLADEQIAAAPKDEAMPELSLTDAMEELNTLAAAFDDPELVSREMAEFDELAQTADAYAKAVKEAGNCMLRRGAA